MMIPTPDESLYCPTPDSGSQDLGEPDGENIMQRYIDACTRHLDPYEYIPSLSNCASLDFALPLSWSDARGFRQEFSKHGGEALEEWLSDDTIGALHISGPYGSGTTFLACTIAQSLCVDARNPTISYHIPPARSSEVFTARGVLASLCQQALLKFPNANSTEDLCGFLLDNPEVTFSKDIFRAILCSLVASLSDETVLCLVTGIENLTESHRADLVKDLDTILNHTDDSCRNFKLLLTSDGSQTFNLTHPHKALPLERSQKCCRFLMQSFLNRRLPLLDREETIAPLWELLGISKSQFSDWLLNSCENMADLALKLDFLQHNQSPPAQRKGDAVKLFSRIQIPPSGRFEVLLQDLPSEGPGINWSSLIWILFSVRPLSRSEFLLCSSLRQDQEKFPPNELVKMWDNSSGNPVQELKGSPLGYIYHFSNDRICLSPGPEYHATLLKMLQARDGIPQGNADLFLTRECLSYLTTILTVHNDLDELPRLGPGDRSRKCLDLLRYAVLYWPEHCRRAFPQEETLGSATEQICQFLRNETLFHGWKTLYNHEQSQVPGHRSELEGIAAIMSPLDVATYFSLDGVLDRLLPDLPKKGRRRAKHRTSAIEDNPTITVDIEHASRAMEIAISRGNSHAIRQLHERCKGVRIPPDARQRLATRGHGAWSMALFDRDCQVPYTVPQQIIQCGHSAILGNGSIQWRCDDESESLGLTPLHIAARMGSLEVVMTLLNGNGYQRHEDVNTCDTRGYNALMYAADGGFHQVVEFLLEKILEAPCSIYDGPAKLQAVVNRANNNGDTALHLATRRGLAKVVSLLLSHNARIDATNIRGETLLHLACQSGSLRVLSRLLNSIRSRLAKTQNLVVAAAIRLALLARDSAGNTPLHVAAAHGHVRIIDFLLDSNENPDIYLPIDLPSKLGRTPLHLAAEAGHQETCRSLLGTGAFKLALDGDGNTPVDWAEKGGYQDLVYLFESF